MRVICLFVCVCLVSLASMAEGQKFTPEFFTMLQSVLAKLKVDKSKLASLGESGNLLEEIASPDMLKETVEPSTTEPTRAHVNQGTDEDYCEKQSPAAFQNFCRTPGMLPGYYVDPWDPYCGYIICHPEGNASRHYCEKGSWTGFKATSSGRRAMCRVQLKLANKKGRCGKATYLGDLCRKAEWVVEYNTLMDTL